MILTDGKISSSIPTISDTGDDFIIVLFINVDLHNDGTKDSSGLK